MDDLEFRRRILAEPKCRDQQITNAIRNSETNNRFAEDILELDKQIEQAFQVDVPDDLADKILFNQASQSGGKRLSQKALALAASLAFTAGILVGQLNWRPLLGNPAYATLADTAIEHINNEAAFINTLDEQVAESQINAKLLPFAYQFVGTLPYHVYYLNHCGFADNNALHMVFQGNKGKVTLFVTNIKTDKQTTFSQKNLTGIVVPIDNTSMILVGEQGENIAEIADVLKAMIQPSS